MRYLLDCDDELTMRVNDHGDLPLHLACQAHADGDIIDFLISAYPESVHTPGHNGQLALHAWFRDAPSRECHTVDNEAIAVIITKYPNALQTRDNKGFYPVHLARCWDLDVIYQLLLACPSTI